MKENAWGYRKRLLHIISQLRPDDTVLDVGCGNGSQLAIPLAAAGFNVVGIDPHRESIDRANSACSQARFICGHLEQLPQQQFNVIVISEVLEHLREPGALLRTARRYLAAGGRVIVTVPNGYGEFEWDWWLCRKLSLVPRIEAGFRALRRLRGKPEPPFVPAGSDCADGHVQFFTLPRIRRTFEEAGFVIIASRGGPLCCGPLASYVLAHSSTLRSINAGVTDCLPMQMASGWYFTLEAASPAK